MDDKEILALYDRDMRIDIEYPGMSKETSADIVRFLRQGPGMSFVRYSRLNADNADERIAEQVARFAGWHRPYSWDLFSHDQPPDLLERLKAHGFEPEEEPGAVMVLDLSEAPAELFSASSGSLRKVKHKEQLTDVIHILETVWSGENFNWINERFPAQMKMKDYLSIYVAEMDGKPVSCAWIYFYPRNHFAGLYGGATLPEYRGGGHYKALLSVRAREARQRGYRFLTLDAGAMSKPIVERRGFRTVSTVTTCTWKSGSGSQ